SKENTYMKKTIPENKKINKILKNSKYLSPKKINSITIHEKSIANSAIKASVCIDKVKNSPKKTANKNTEISGIHKQKIIKDPKKPVYAKKVN
ncbi:MAG: hypothetical protein MHPSP_002106, partial [Paramarteilia canceri]